MSLTSYDQILKGLLNQKRVAKLYMEKDCGSVHDNTDLDMLHPGYNGRGTPGQLVGQWTHCIPVPATSMLVLPVALTT